MQSGRWTLRPKLGRVAMGVLQRLPLHMRREMLFLRFHRRWGHFRNPRTFNEKVNWRILYDRRSELAWTCDKLSTKERAAAVGIRAPVTYWQGVEVAEIAEVALPERWVLKPNHRSGLVYFGKGKPDVPTLLQLTRGWSRDWQSERMGEWAYAFAQPVLLVEEQLEPTGTPVDYKFFVMDGRVVVLTLDLDRFGDHRRLFYTPDWELLDVQCAYPVTEPQRRPPQLAEMVAAAQRLAGGFDFLRVDLYLVEGIIMIGEVSCYPGGGLDPMHPRSFDTRLGSSWRLPTLPGTPVTVRRRLSQAVGV